MKGNFIKKHPLQGPLIQRFILGILLSILIIFPSFNIWADARIISLSPVVTEILFEIQAQDDITAVTTICNYPKETRRYPKVHGYKAQIKEILKYDPTLVIGIGNDPYIESKLSEVGVPCTIFSSPKSIDEMLRLILSIGELTQKTETASQTVQRLQNEIAILKKNQPPTPAKVAVIINALPIITVGHPTFITDVIQIAGGINAFDTIPIEFPTVSKKALLTQKPDLILTGPDVKKNLMATFSDFPTLNIPIDDSIDFDLIVRAGPRLIEGAKHLQKRLWQLSSQKEYPTP